MLGRSNSTVLVFQWYLLTALSSHLADQEIVIVKRSLNQVGSDPPPWTPLALGAPSRGGRGSAPPSTWCNPLGGGGGLTETLTPP